MPKVKVRMSEVVHYEFEIEVDDLEKETVREAAEEHFVNSNASLTSFTFCENRKVDEFKEVT